MDQALQGVRRTANSEQRSLSKQLGKCVALRRRGTLKCYLGTLRKQMGGKIYSPLPSLAQGGNRAIRLCRVKMPSLVPQHSSGLRAVFRPILFGLPRFCPAVTEGPMLYWRGITISKKGQKAKRPASVVFLLGVKLLGVDDDT